MAHGAQVHAPPQPYYWMSVHALLPPERAKVADSSLPLQLLRLSERENNQNNRAFIEILNYCFLTPSPQSKAVTLLPTVARLMMDVSEPCLPAGISILSAESASRLNKECEEAAAEALPRGVTAFRTVTVFNRHV